jgi:hypothetical protein
VLYGPAILLFICALWLALFGGGVLWGVIVLAMLGMTIVFQVRESRRSISNRQRWQRKREH